MKKNFNFGEWLPWEQNASPMLLVLTLNAGMKHLRDYFGMPLWTSVIIFEDGQAKWLFRPKELKLLGRKMMDFLLCPPYRVSFFTGYATAEEKLLTQAKKIQFSAEFSELSDEQLISLFEDYCQTYYGWYKYGWFCEPIQFQAQDILNAFLDSETSRQQIALSAAEARQTLFSIDEDSFVVSILDHLRECAIALAKVLEDSRISKEISGLVENQGFADEASRLVLSAAASNPDAALQALLNKLREHSERFYWKKNNYWSTQFLNEHDVLTEIFSSEGLDLRDPAKRFVNELQQVKENKKAVLSKKEELLSLLPIYLRNIVALVSSVGGSLLDQRKRAIMIANSAFDSILNEVARRTGTNISDVRLLIPQELGYFLSKPSEYRERFAQRRESFLVYQSDFPLIPDLIDAEIAGGQKEFFFGDLVMTEPFIAEGSQVDETLNDLNQELDFLKEGEIEALNKLHGVTTYFDSENPIVEGVVMVIKDPKVQTLESGQILVAPSTTPDYMDAIRRCKAIITDWGGQTSHAAITSRELRKPCIIGTNYASQILRSGDAVKLDLAHGLVEVSKK